jgi:hypothetical protein
MLELSSSQFDPPPRSPPTPSPPTPSRAYALMHALALDEEIITSVLLSARPPSYRLVLEGDTCGGGSSSQASGSRLHGGWPPTRNSRQDQRAGMRDATIVTIARYDEFSTSRCDSEPLGDASILAQGSRSRLKEKPSELRKRA